ncbi:hypothetical protein Atep_06850 [Allochromatium tepidum]|uniref:Metalloprotease TldD/E N-terminal domain-containing protein n=1 Tax=Allochromatium tepidum TaxID=553982 RepID=A0ABM7QJV9_9GAMM|nr:hypothetical protein Atep_06850 [Allochromatium tepidum]
MARLLDIAQGFVAHAPACDAWTLRLVAETSDHLEVRQGVVEPSLIGCSLGAMITVVEGAGSGYAATGDLSPSGLRAAAERALDWARVHARLGLFEARLQPLCTTVADYRTPVEEPWESRALAERLSAGLTGDKVLFCNLGVEVSDFVRLNRNRVRQAGAVHAAGLTLTLIAGAHQAEGGSPCCPMTPISSMRPSRVPGWGARVTVYPPPFAARRFVPIGA